MSKRSYLISWYAKCKTIAVLLLSALCLSSASCGYRLGTLDTYQGKVLSPTLQRMTIQNLKLYDPMRTAMVDHFRLYGIQVANTSQALPSIVIESKKLQEPAVVVGDFARTREVLLSLRVAFSLTYRGHYLIRNQQVQLQETYLYNTNTPNRNQNERAKVLQRLYQKLAEHIVNHLRGIGSKRIKLNKEGK